MIISESALHYLIPTQVKKMSKRHKVMCGCEVCIAAKGMHESLLAYRKKQITRLQKEAEDA